MVHSADTHGAAGHGPGDAGALRRGDVVLAALAILTAAEFAVAVTVDGNPLLAALSVLGLVKAALIVNYFMHFRQLWEHIATVWDAYLFPQADEDD